MPEPMSESEVLEQEVRRHISITTWDKLLEMLDGVVNWGRQIFYLASTIRAGLLRHRDDLYGCFPV